MGLRGRSVGPITLYVHRGHIGEWHILHGGEMVWDEVVLTIEDRGRVQIP